jgi:hypothetical protein
MSSPNKIVDDNTDTTAPPAPHTMRITFIHSRDPRNVRPVDRPSSSSSSTDDEEPALAIEYPSTLPSESTSPTRAPSIQSRMDNVASRVVLAPARKRRNPNSDDAKPRSNGCPEAGTNAAYIRTLHASYARCKTEEAKRLFKANKNLPEDWEPEPPKENTRRKKPKLAAQDNPKRQCTASPRNREQRVTQMPLPPVTSDFHQETSGPWDDALIAEQRWVQRYHEGQKAPHLFCVIARVTNEYEKEDKSSEHDYHCFSAVLHPRLDGREALRFTNNFLSAIRSNSGALRCELNQAVQGYRAKARVASCLLESILVSCFTSVTPVEPSTVFNAEMREKINPKSSLHVEHN